MNLESLAKPSVLTQPVYEPGKPIEDVAREIGIDPAGIIKLASNENPIGPSPRAIAAAQRALLQGQLYPDGSCLALRQKLAAAYGLSPEQFVVGNGSNEILELLGHAFLAPGDEAIMGTPAFLIYKLVTLLFGAQPVEVPLREFRHDLAAMAKAVTARTKLVFVGCPNNPTGTINPAAEVMAFARSLPGHVILAFDEAYAEFQDSPADLRPLIAEGRKIICLRTFSKLYGLASLRVGYGYSSREMAGLLGRTRQPFNVNAIGQAAALAALDDREFVARYQRENRNGMRQLEEGAKALGLATVPSQANFLLVKVGQGQAWFEALEARGIIVRPLRPYGLPEYIRITVGTRAQNNRLLAEMEEIMRVFRAGTPASEPTLPSRPGR
jgi:histidinol-phosphate aminotransferase